MIGRRALAALATFGIAFALVAPPAGSSESGDTPGSAPPPISGPATAAPLLTGDASGDAGLDIDKAEDEALAKLAFAGGVVSAATTSARAANSLTAAGMHIVPRYMTRPGDLDISALGGFASYPALGGSLLGAQLSLQARLSDGLVLLIDTGHLTSLALRGPVWGDDRLTVGWDARYRSDIYLELSEGFGLSAPGFGLMPGFPGAAAQGVEVAANAEYGREGLRLYLSPSLLVMSNRTAPAAAVGIDWDLDRLTVGYGASLQYAVVNPGSSLSTVLEQKHSVGARFYLADWAYVQANYHYQPADSYGQPSSVILAGIGTRLLGNFTVPAVQVAAQPLPEPEPTTEPEPEPEPEATPEPAEREWDSLKGRVFHSAATGDKPLAVALKVLKAGKWVGSPETTKTDERGNYVFHRLPDGQYQVVYRFDNAADAVVGAAVSPVAQVRPEHTAVMDLDVAWDEVKIRARLSGKTVTVTWPAKPGFKNVIYQVVLKYAPDQPYIVGSPYSARTEAKLQLSDEVARHKLYYTVKFLKRGGKWEGANYYGQSRYKVVEVDR